MVSSKPSSKLKELSRLFKSWNLLSQTQSIAFKKYKNYNIIF